MLNLLVKKGKATRELKDRAFLYRQAMDRNKAVRLALNDLIDRMFGGSAENLVMGLVESRQLEPEKLAELHKTIKRNRGKNHV
jgi:predicted transcriptional regulator